MKILHICNDYCGSKVHANLYRCLDALGVEQTVYCAMRDASRTGKNRFDGERTDFICHPIVKPVHHYLYHVKIRTTYKDLLQSVVPAEYNLCHASTLFSDGAIAYRLNREYGLPYMVAVRNTDVNDFLRLAPHTWRYGKRILLAASRIIFITPAIRQSFCSHPYIKRFLPQIVTKFEVIPNGIEDYWIDNRTEMGGGVK